MYHHSVSVTFLTNCNFARLRNFLAYFRSGVHAEKNIPGWNPAIPIQEINSLVWVKLKLALIKLKVGGMLLLMATALDMDGYCCGCGLYTCCMWWQRSWLLRKAGTRAWAGRLPGLAGFDCKSGTRGNCHSAPKIIWRMLIEWKLSLRIRTHKLAESYLVNQVSSSDPIDQWGSMILISLLEWVLLSNLNVIYN